MIFRILPYFLSPSGSSESELVGRLDRQLTATAISTPLTAIIRCFRALLTILTKTSSSAPDTSKLCQSAARASPSQHRPTKAHHTRYFPMQIIPLLDLKLKTTGNLLHAGMLHILRAVLEPSDKHFWSTHQSERSDYLLAHSFGIRSPFPSRQASPSSQP